MSDWQVAYDPKSKVPGLGHRVVLLARKPRPRKRPPVRHPSDLFELMKGAMDLDREAVYVALVHDGVLSGVYIASVGGIATSVADITIIVRVALIAGADSMVLVHNHPSGRSLPSPEDRVLTTKVMEALDVFDIVLLDHLIVSRAGYYSFSEDL